jgi:hypothetical protein
VGTFPRSGSYDICALNVFPIDIENNANILIVAPGCVTVAHHTTSPGDVAIIFQSLAHLRDLQLTQSASRFAGIVRCGCHR